MTLHNDFDSVPAEPLHCKGSTAGADTRRTRQNGLGAIV